MINNIGVAQLRDDLLKQLEYLLAIPISFKYHSTYAETGFLYEKS